MECMKSTREKELELIAVTDRCVEIMHDLFGFYLDAHQGFILYKNKVEDEALKSYVPSRLWANKSPIEVDAVFHHVASAKEIAHRNSPEGSNIFRTRNYVIVMITEHWDRDIRIKIAEVLGLENVNDIKSDIMSDLNKIRQDVLHKRGKAENSVKNKIIKFKLGDPIEISPEIFDLIFKNIIKDLNDLCLKYTGKKGYQDHSLNPQLKAWHSKPDKDLYIWRGTSLNGV